MTPTSVSAPLSYWSPTSSRLKSLLLLILIFISTQLVRISHFFYSLSSSLSNRKPLNFQAYTSNSSNELLRHLINSSPSISALLQENEQEHFNVLNVDDDDTFSTNRFHFLRDYIKWHATTRACFLSNSCKNTPRLLVWRCPGSHGLAVGCAGVGDRLRGAKFALALAIFTRRLLFIDWPADPYPVTVAVVPSYIDWRVPAKLNSSTDFNKWPTLHWYGCSYTPKTVPCRLNRQVPHDDYLPTPKFGHPPDIPAQGPFINLSILSPSPIFRSNINTSTNSSSSQFYSVHILQHMYMNLIISTRHEATSTLLLSRLLNYTSETELDKLKAEFDPLQHVLLHALFTQSNLVRTVLDKMMPIQPELSVHVRTGMDVNEGGEERFLIANRGGMSTIARQILVCMSELLKKSDGNVVIVKKSGNVVKKTIYIATDSSELKKEFKRIYSNAPYSRRLTIKQPNMSLNSINYTSLRHTIHLVMSDVSAIHIQTDNVHHPESSFKNVQNDGYWETQKLVQFINVFLDFFAIASSSSVISNGSGFSRLAYLLGNGTTWKELYPFTNPAEVCRKSN